MKVEIVGLNKIVVLLSLYNNAKFAGKEFASQPMMKVMYAMDPLGNIEAAETVIEEATKSNNFNFDYVDLGAGPRPLNVDLSSFDFDPTLYDCNHSHDGYAAKIISDLRKAEIIKSKDAPKDSFASLLCEVGLAFKSKAESKQSVDSTNNVTSGPSA